MVMIIVILILYVLPISIGILILRFILVRLKNKKIANRVSLVLFAMLIIIFSIILIRDYNSRTHNLSFQLTNNCIIDVYATEQGSFREWPILFNILIKDSNGNIVDELEFSTTEGPYLKFYIDSVTVNRLVIEGYNRNVGIEEYVRLNEFKTDVLNQESNEIRITGNFTLIKQ